MVDTRYLILDGAGERSLALFPFLTRSISLHELPAFVDRTLCPRLVYLVKGIYQTFPDKVFPTSLRVLCVSVVRQP